MLSKNSIYQELSDAKLLIYDQLGLTLNEYYNEDESIEYSACKFKLNKQLVIHRTAKITPTKIGQFVTIWKRNKEGITAPFDLEDNFGFIIITVKTAENFGQFIFPKQILLEKGIISGKVKKGKRGIRVYPPWDIAVNKQAIQTQKWQLQYFLALSDRKQAGLNLLTSLFNLTKPLV